MKQGKVPNPWDKISSAAVKGDKVQFGKITLYRHESAVQKVGNAESSTF